MCPSDQPTLEAEHSTRGRARLLFEMLNGHGDAPIADGWRSSAMRDALDLCRACKGCKKDCPADVGMASYKACCCGLAGNFGFQRGHYDVSVACAEHVLLPSLRAAAAEAVILADGFSCRTQVHELDSGGREAIHLAELPPSGEDLAGRYPEHSLPH